MTNNRIVVNNATLDPIQGFHLNVYMNDQANGEPVLVGGFTSFQKTMRNATEAYMPFGRKTPRLLDGEFQYGWVLERGLLDIGILKDVFGVDEVGPEFKADPTPRFVITVEVNAPELDQRGVNFPIRGNLNQSGSNNGGRARNASGKYQLIYAKIDSVTLGAMAGRSVVATRFEGLCESIRFIDNSANNTLLPTSSNRLGVKDPQLNGVPRTVATGSQGGTPGQSYLYT